MNTLISMFLKLRWLGLELSLSWEKQDQKLSSKGGGMSKRRKKED